MGFEIGNSASKGRPKGSGNLTTKNVREAFNKLVEGNLERIQSDLDSLAPKDRLRFLIDLSAFVLPKLKQTEAQIEHTVAESFDIRSVFRFEGDEL